jgi:hypothetical protein
MNEKVKICCIAVIVGIVIGAVFTELIFYRERSRSAGELDNRYALQLGRTTEIVSRLEEELGLERELNLHLREHNNRARELAAGITDTTERNVRNLQEAVGLIGEIRKKLKVLEDFYIDRDSFSGPP